MNIAVFIVAALMVHLYAGHKRRNKSPEKESKRRRSRSPRERPERRRPSPLPYVILERDALLPIDWGAGFQDQRVAQRPPSPPSPAQPSLVPFSYSEPAEMEPSTSQEGTGVSEYDQHTTVSVGAKDVKVRGHVTTIRAHRLKLENLDRARRPLQDLFVEAVDCFIDESLKAEDLDPKRTKFCLILRHPQLAEKDGVFLPYRKTETTNGLALWNLMTKFGQSNKALRIDETFEIIIHAYTPWVGDVNKDGFVGSCSDNPMFDEKKRLNNVLLHEDGKCLLRSLLIAREAADIAHTKQEIDQLKEALQKTANATATDQLRQELQAAEDRLDVFQKTFKQWTNRHRNNGNKTLKSRLEELTLLAGLLSDSIAYDARDIARVAAIWKDYEIVLYTRRSDTQKFYYKAAVWNEGGERQINIALFQGHYNPFKPTRHTINSIICRFCKKGFKKNYKHVCKHRCLMCHHPGCENNSGEEIHCKDCNIRFHDKGCYDRHLLPIPGKIKTTASSCKMYKICKKCFIFHRTSSKHVCNTDKYCKLCRKKVKNMNSHNCCWTVPNQKTQDKLREKQSKFTIVTYDVETIVAGETTQKGDYAPAHAVNMVCWRRMCHKCWEDPALQADRDADCGNCGKRHGSFSNLDPKVLQQTDDDAPTVMGRFVEFLLTDPKNANAYVLAHNGSGYDNHFILAELLEKKEIPKIVPNGRRLMTVNVDKSHGINKLTFKDSWLLVPLPLAEMPKAFNLPSQLRKGEFPYLFNHPRNYGKVLTELPEPKFYCVDSKKPEAYESFMKWWNENRHRCFDFDKELLEYCRTDVDILEQGLIKFMQTSIKMSGWNPVIHCATYAAYTMFVLKNNYLKTGQMAVLPENGYFHGQNQSSLAIKYIRWLENTLGYSLQHQESPCGEKQFRLPGRPRAVRVDAFDANMGTVTEVLGCMYHGCPRCFSKDSPHPLRPDAKMGAVYDETMLRIAALEKHKEIQNVDLVWECEIHRQLKKDREMKEFFDSQWVTGRLKPRDAFLGGRTQTFRLIAEASANEEICYWDFCSLYPWICAMVASYPCGQPKVIVKDLAVDFDGKKESPHRGLIKCDVLCPRNLYYPTIGYRHEGRLLFANCRSCMETAEKGECPHTDDNDRKFHVTATDVELSDALKQGYQVLKTYELWKWEDAQWEKGGLFKEFILKYYAEKQKASGWPPGVETDAQKAEFLEELKNRIGVDIKVDEVLLNKAARYVAKLLLNSCWGKTGERPDKGCVEFVECDSPRLGELINDETVDITTHVFINDEIMMITYKAKKEFQYSVPYTNVAYAAITTACARVELLKVLRRLDRRVVYCDTDSVIFLKEKGIKDDLKDLRQGEWLGQLTDEVPEGYKIKKFVSIAPKVYGIRMENDDGEVLISLKVKGVTMDSEAAKKITFETMEEMAEALMKGLPAIEIQTMRTMITKPRLGEISTADVTKTLKAIMTKVRLLPNGHTTPFGFRTS